MKVLFVVFSMLLLSLAWADQAEEFQAKCNTSEIKRLMGPSGSCRIVVSPSVENIKGSCSGDFLDMPCTAVFDSKDKSLEFSCKQNNEDPDLNFLFLAEFTSFRVATIVTGREKTSVILDPVVYKKVSGPSLEVNLNEVTVNGKVSLRPSMIWTNDGGSYELSNVECH